MSKVCVHSHVVEDYVFSTKSIAGSGMGPTKKGLKALDFDIQCNSSFDHSFYVTRLSFDRSTWNTLYVMYSFCHVLINNAQ